MGLINYFKSLFTTDKDSGELVELKIAYEDFAVNDLAINTAINHISGMVSKCEFKTYKEYKKTNEDEYYLWNFEPNKNQSGCEFKKNLISKLLKNNEVLVIEKNGQLFIADSFSKEINGTSETLYKDIEINKVKELYAYRESEVLCFKLNSESIKKCLDRLNSTYQNLMKYTEKAYRRSKGFRGVLNISANAMGNTEAEKRINTIFNEKLKPFFENDNSVLPLYDGFDFQEVNNRKEDNSNTRDLKSQMDDVFDFVARGFNIPPAILKGDVLPNKEIVDNYIMFCISPIVAILESEINRKRNGKEVEKGTYLKVNTTAIKHIDIVTSAMAVDKLIASGVCSINDILEIFEMEKVADEWADTHYITKNYTTFEEIKKGDG